MAEEDPPTLEQALFDAFGEFLNPGTPALRRVLSGSLKFAKVERGGGLAPSSEGAASDPNSGVNRQDDMIVVDKRALLASIIVDGKNNGELKCSSAWLVIWMEKEAIDPGPFLKAVQDNGGVKEAYRAGDKIVASASLRTRILPMALELARKTVAREWADLRHLMFAILSEPFVEAELVPSDRLPALREWLVENIVEGPEPDENLDAWRELLATQASLTPDRSVETVRTLTDAPAHVDSLGRQVFAEVLAKRIHEIHATLPKNEPGNDSAFILHIDGPWGSGKSSILNFLKADLRTSKPSWLVVEFNAWRNQNRKPPWWPLISAVHESQIGSRAHIVRLWWRIRMDWAPYLIALGFLLVAALLAWAALSGKPADLKAAQEVTTFGLTKRAFEVFLSLLAALTAIGAFLTWFRGVAHGSTRNAEIYLETRKEPFGPIIHHFEKLIAAIGRPVAVFIDDLDRCDGTYVVEFLEGLQTLLRSAPVVYVVAGDRKWISSSFGKRYAEFSGDIGEPGRPIGYLFLDKVFQLSTSVPQLSTERRASYWRELLDREDAKTAAAGREQRQQAAEREAERALRNLTRHEDIQNVIDAASDDEVKQEALRAAAAKQTTSSEAIREAEHRLQPLATLLEANPRSMKRLVNAYGLNQARAYLEGRSVPVEALARWTIIELRWPLLADYVVKKWPHIDLAAPPEDQPRHDAGALLQNDDVKAVIGKGERWGLDKANLSLILD